MWPTRLFAPYGESYNNVGITGDLNFTGDYQDLVAGTYDTPNRKLNPTQGRWISPDPARASWNAYAYSTNPMGETDPSGACPPTESGNCLYSNQVPHTVAWSHWGDIVSDMAGAGANFQNGWWGNDAEGGAEAFFYSKWQDPGCGSACSTVGGGTVWDTGIMSYHADASGTLVGDFPGEQDCATNNGCMVWDPNLQMWETPGEADVYPPKAQGVFQGNPRVWSSANGTINNLAMVYVAIPVLVAAPEVSLGAAAAAETNGIPITAISIWAIENEDTLEKVSDFGKWIFEQCQINGPC